MVIFVGNFSSDTVEQDLRDKFERYGPITAINVMRDEISDRVLGFGFVEMGDEEGGQRAVADLDRSKLKGSTLIVCETAPRVERRRLPQKQSPSTRVRTPDQG